MSLYLSAPQASALVCRGGVCAKRAIYRIMRAEVPAVVLVMVVSVAVVLVLHEGRQVGSSVGGSVGPLQFL